MRPDLSVIVTFHREGLLAHPALVSIQRAIQRAGQAGFACEAILTLDRPDDLTREIVEGWKGFEARILTFQAGDVARVRNAAIAAAQGEFVAILDGDDLCGSEWLHTAIRHAHDNPGRSVWRPELVLQFERFGQIWAPRELDEQDETLKVADSGCWPAYCVIRRDLALEVPYPPIDGKFPFEDWAWSIAIVEAGIVNRIVPGTGLAYRGKRQGSIHQINSVKYPLGRQPTQYFRRLLEERIARDSNNVVMLRP